MRLLLIDTCGPMGTLALAEDRALVRRRSLPARAASAGLIGAIREELAALSWPLGSLAAIAVVNGPGSFTGVRVGLAAAKGLCDAAGLPLVSVSRLAVLLAAAPAGEQAIAVLDAGRGEFYVRSSGSGEEQLVSRRELASLAEGRSVVFAEAALQAAVQAAHSELGPTLVPLTAADALPLATAQLEAGGDDVAAADANYVRHARTLYASAGGANEPGAKGSEQPLISSISLVRVATQADLFGILALDRSTLEAPHWNQAAYRRYLAADAAEPVRKALLVSVQADVLCGYVAFAVMGDEAELESMVVADSSRRTGLGSRLLRAAERWAQDRGARTLFLEVRSANQGARSFYAAHAFTPVGLRPGYYASPADDAVLLRKNLSADEL